MADTCPPRPIPTSPAPDQCVILVGGLGTRLGSLTADCPKPLLPVLGAPFLDQLLAPVARFGFSRVLLLAGHHGQQVIDYARTTPWAGQLDIDVLVEPAPLGTAGALALARDRLDDCFLLLNGDSLFDFNWLDLVPALTAAPESLAVLGLRRLADASRFGVVTEEHGRVTGFAERGTAAGGLVNGGVYLMRRAILDHLPAAGSLESLVLPALAAAGRVRGRIHDGFFLDIGVPDSYASADRLIGASRPRPAVFFDRDGVLNLDHGYVASRDRFDWVAGAVAAVKRVNDRGWFAFVVTNQGGVGHGFYDEAAVNDLHRFMQGELRRQGAHIDAFRYCPDHPQAEVAAYRRENDWRKPGPGMLHDLMAHWPVIAEQSLIIGDRPTDLAAGAAAGVAGHFFDGTLPLDQFIAPLLG